MGNLTSIHDNQKPIISNFVDLDESIDDVFTHTLNSYLFRDNFYYIPNYLTAAIYKFPASHQNFTFLQKCITLVNKYNNMINYISDYISNNKDIDVNEINNEGVCALHLAAYYSTSLNTSIVLNLLISNNNIDINKRDNFGNNALHYILLNNVASDVNVNDVKILLAAGININAINDYGHCPLYLAINNNHSNEIIKLLIESEINISNNTNFLDVLHKLYNRKDANEIAEIIIKSRINLRYTDFYERNILHLAVININKDNIINTISMINLMIERGVDVNCVDSSRKTALHYLCNLLKYVDHVDFVNIINVDYINYIVNIAIILIKNNADLSIMDNKGKTPLHIVCKYSRFDIDGKLLEHIATNDNINIKNNKGNSALHYCCLWSNKTSSNNTITTLINKFNEIINLNIINNNKQTPLYLAATNTNHTSNLETVKILVNAGASIFISSNDIYTPLYSACIFSNTTSTIDTVNFLIDKIKSTNDNEKLDQIDKFGNSLLHIACLMSTSTSSNATAITLIKNGANINLKNFYGSTPLHMVCLNKNFIPKIESNKPLNLIKYLIQNGAIVNEQNNKGSSPLHLACQFIKNIDYVDTIMELIRANADITMVNESGQNILHIITEQSNRVNLEALSLILSKRIIDVNCGDKLGNTALYNICSCNKFKQTIDIGVVMIEQLDLLILAGAKTDVQNKLKQSLLHSLLIHAKQSVVLDVIEYLIKYGANINAVDYLGKNCLHYLIQNSSLFNLENVNKLISLGITPNITDNEDRNALHYMIIHSKKDYMIIFEQLIKHGCDVNQKDIYHMTPLLYAIRNYTGSRDIYYNIMDILLKNSAILDINNENGVSSLIIELEKKNMFVIDFIKIILNNRVSISNNLLEYIKENCHETKLIKIIKKYKLFQPNVNNDKNIETKTETETETGIEIKICDICTYDTNIIECNFKHYICLTCLNTINKYICEACRTSLL